MSEAEQRASIEAAARSWLGTPYHHCARVKSVGVDCANLLIAVYSEAGLIEAFDPGYYSPQFFMYRKEERFLGWVLKFAHEIDETQVKPGDIVLYRLGHVYAHGAIVVSPGWPKIIHALARCCVLEANGLDGIFGSVRRKPRFFSRW